MIDSQEIIERSFYKSILSTLLTMGLTLDPEEYDDSKVSLDKYKKDKEDIITAKGFFIELYGASNNQEKGIKLTPRIVINPQGFIPGSMGLDGIDYEKSEGSYNVSEVPYEAVDQYINIHLVCRNIKHKRVLHQVLARSLPQRGYLKPYVFDKKPFAGNIFTQLVNFIDSPELAEGIIENIYVYEIKDTLLNPPRVIDNMPPIKEIHVDIYHDGNNSKDSITI